MSPDPLLPAPLTAALPRIRAAARPVVLLDGRSGSGKTSLAAVLAPLLGADLIALDDLYPGWGGLAAGSAAVAAAVLRAEDPGWRGWDWSASVPTGWHPVDPGRPLVIEGCGALTRANRARATYGIWLEAPAELRRERALSREPGFAAEWDHWAAQEDALLAAEHSPALADLVLAVPTRAG